MNAVRDGDFLEAVQLTREDNPLPSILGRVCDHLCENTCIRTHFDQPLAIRHIKRFIMEQEEQPVLFTRNPSTKTKVAIIGAGPAGLAAAQELGYCRFAVTIFEAHPYAGGMVGGAIPSYRLPQEADRPGPGDPRGTRGRDPLQPEGRCGLHHRAISAATATSRSSLPLEPSSPRS